MTALSKSSWWIISGIIYLPYLSRRRSSHECCLYYGVSDLEIGTYLKQLYILHWRTNILISVPFCIWVGVCVCAVRSLVFDIRWRRQPHYPRSWVQKAKSKIRGLYSILTSLPNFGNIRVIFLRFLCGLNVTLPSRRHCPLADRLLAGHRGRQGHSAGSKTWTT